MKWFWIKDKKKAASFTAPELAVKYHTRQWQRLRLLILSRSPYCVQCGKRANVVDHINPVRLGGEMFDETNLQSMCSKCHNSKSSRERHEQHI